MPQLRSGFLMNTSEWRTTGTQPRGKTAGWWSIGLVLVFFASMAHGQAASGTQAAPAPAAPAPSVSTNVDEVTLDLVVHDKRHKPVLDLKPEDVAVTDNGNPVKLNAFRLVRGDANAGHMVTLVFDRLEGPIAKSARLMAEKILKALPKGDYSFAVMDIGGRLRLLQGFTEDRTAVDQAVTLATESNVSRLESTLSQGVSMATDKAEPERAKAAEKVEKNLIAIARTGVDSSGRHVDVKERARAQTVLKALQDARLIVQDQHENRALAGILALVRSQQQLTERKAVIYFTLNQLLDSGSKEMLKTIGGAATMSGVTIYTVDLDAMNIAGQRTMENALANGQQPYEPQRVATSAYTSVLPMQQQGSGAIAGAPSMQGAVWGQAQDMQMATDFMRGNNEDPNQFREIKSPMSDLSKNTGGLYIDAQVSVKGPLQQMIQDMTTYYQASYTPPAQEYDGTFRTIGVKPIRAGLDIRTKTGYFALAPSAEAGIRPFEAPLLKVLSQPQLPNDMNFHAAILQFGELPDGNTSTLAVEVPISQLQTKEDTQTKLDSAHVSIVAQIKDKSGTVVEHFAEDITRRGALESSGADKSAAITLQRHFMAIPGQYVMEIAVLDRLSGRASAQRVDFEIPQVQGGPSLSDMVLVRKVDAYHEEDDPLEPMRYEKSKITPNLSAQLPGKANSVSLFLILHPDPKTSEPATLEMEVSRNGVAGRRTPLPLPIQSSVGGNAIPYMANFRATSFTPGIYTVKTTMTQGGKTAGRELSFFVPGDVQANAQAGAGAAAVADLKLEPAASDLHPATQLVITALANPMPAPTLDEIQAMIADARQRAVGYADALPNFMCVEVTDRSFDPNGSGRWKHRDTISELMRHFGKEEMRTVLEVDGKPAANSEHEAIQGPTSTGEYGSVLGAIFAPSAKADFSWKETDTLGDGTVQVFNYKVAKENSNFSVRGLNGEEPFVTFHGLVFIDSATRGVRRVTLVADDLPKDFPTVATSISVDYDYVVINAHDYLMPVSAEVSLKKKAHHETDLNTKEFRNYRRFASNVKILNFTPLAKQ